jgi:glyoxylase-like metal-dependent hydrolase (beta-lactamase superfamily II)
MTIQKISGKYSTNTYIVHENGLAIVIDPSGDADQIYQCATAQGSRPVAILLTHGHFDHIDALQDLMLKFDAKVYISRDDFPMLSDPHLNASWLVFENISVSVKDPILLNGGETLCFGSMKFEALATPGHTSGSLCYLSEDALFSGDTLFADGYGRTDLPNSSPEKYASSILFVNKLLKTHTLYPGHGRILNKE